MPIRAEYRALGLYGRAWRRFRLRLIGERGARCADCGRAGERYLNVSHDRHDPRTDLVTLRCPACHARYDARQAFAVRRRRRAERSGQLWLWIEVEYAVTPRWALPRAALRAAQGRLFA
jgi:hypothetical protein